LRSGPGLPQAAQDTLAQQVTRVSALEFAPYEFDSKPASPRFSDVPTRLSFPHAQIRIAAHSSHATLCHSDIYFRPFVFFLLLAIGPLSFPPLFLILSATFFLLAHRKRLSWTNFLIASAVAVVVIAPAAGYAVTRLGFNPLGLNCDLP
jgi:hypothetical protein